MPAAYLRFEYGMRVAVMLFTRGKGGQNSSAPETGDSGETSSNPRHEKRDGSRATAWVGRSGAACAAARGYAQWSTDDPW